MRLLFFCLMLVCSVSCKDKFDDKNYTKNKQSLALNEKQNPEQFLKIYADNKKNVFGATVVKGKLVNTASVCIYKNARIKMLCYKNNVRVEEHEDVFKDAIKPGIMKNFKTKYHLPKGTDSIALSVISADVIFDSTK